MSKAPTLDPDLFLQRAKLLYKQWDEGVDSLSDVEAFYVCVGADENAPPYSKSAAFQTWLYSCELLDCLALFTKKEILILASNKKADFFKAVASKEHKDNVPPITTIHRDKSDKDAANFARLVEAIAAKQKLGTFIKDKFDSEFVKSFDKALEKEKIEKVDISAAFVPLFASKDSKGVEHAKNAATCSANAWVHARKKLVSIIDEERKVKHSTLAEDLERDVGSVQVQGPSAKSKHIDTCYTPIIMSGGKYSFKWNNSSSDSHIQYGNGTIITSLGVRYENYCSNVTRTLLISPSSQLEEIYETVLVAEMALIEALKPGTKLSHAYQKVIDTIKEKNPALLDKLYKKEFGFATGVEFRESALTISPKCEEKVTENMTFIVYIGLEGLQNRTSDGEERAPAAIALSDTILVVANGPNEILTDKAKSRLKSNVIRFKEDAPGSERGAEKENGTEALGRGQRSVVLNDQTRNKTTNEDKRKERQKELAEQLNRNAQQRLAQQSGGQDVKKVKKSNVSYKSYEKFPQEDEIDKLQIHVDKRHDTIILPIFGLPVPFHISCIKNCSQSVEGDFTYLRINFNHPGSNISKESVQFPNPLATYLKELTYRATNVKEPGELNPPSYNLNTSFRLIKELQKRFRTEEAEEREKEGAVKQDKLILSTNKANPKLKDLYIRPNIITKRISGSLEAHINGFRYTSLRGDRIDVLYNNIKHALFQPCDNEMIILIHFHLTNPVMWGKKKYKDVQFYTEVGEITTDLGKYHHMQDRDDVQSEQMEREMRRKLNATFTSFCDKVRKQTNDQIDFDSPFHDLGFFGVPFRSSCTLHPTSLCLVNLTEWPPFIVTLSEVELVHFERVSFQLKNFDMVFIFKDYHRKTQMIQQIPMSSLDTIKEWLNSCDIRYTEGIQSLNWPKIMKTITDDPEDFFEQGGWDFLDNSSDGEEEAEVSSESDSYNPSDEDDEAASDESDEDESEGEATSEEESEASLDSDESSGKSWSDLEQEAEKADKRKDQEQATTSRNVDRKRPGGGSSRSGPPMKKRR